ncbi:Mlp family lipoprotein [Borrelia duttonii]|uniref:ORFk-like protein, lipoprotein n=1 Tax=Borrelia duttonii (strain Ly) TaxID=412419 RepID=B5RP85_BORDL|nr:ORFk-like protein, lipoprotein [Borrelia duttonii Ly]
MNKNKSMLILYITLFLYGCDTDKFGNKLQTQSLTTLTTKQKLTTQRPNVTMQKSKIYSSQKPILSAEEEDKFKLLKYALDMDLKAYQQHYTNPKAKKVANIYSNIIQWISNDLHIQEQKDLINSFNHIYTFIKNKLDNNPNMDIIQYIKGAYYNFQDDEYKKAHTYDSKLYGNLHGEKHNSITMFFYLIKLNAIERQTNLQDNEEFYKNAIQKIKNELQDKTSDSYKHSLALWKD